MGIENIKLESQIELIDSTDEAFSSVSLNPNFQWGKVVICDDQPNLNKMRIPESEFDNLIRTGINSPIKMDYGKITGHEEAQGKPIGVISQIKKETNKLIALVALWKKEREEDIAMLKDMYLKNQPPQTSWEIGYSEMKTDDKGIQDLFGTMLNGLAVVANPAYAGRTGFVAMSSKTENLQENSMEELDQLKARVTELETLLASKETELTSAKSELKTLQDFKAEIDKKEADETKLANIRKKFIDAKIEKDDAFYAEKRETLLGLEDSAVDFMIQEMVAFSTAQASTEHQPVKIPNIPNVEAKDLDDPVKLAKALRELRDRK
jgi:hypothetical protein